MRDWVLEDLQINNLFIYQPKSGYRFTSDAVALANYVSVRNNGNVVDLCSGSGVIGVLVSAKNNVGHTYMIELQPELAQMSKSSIEYNQLRNFTVINRPLQGVADELKDVRIDTVVCNPPYFTSPLKRESEEESIARHEVKVTMSEIIREAARLLKQGGKFYCCYPATRLVDVFATMREVGIEPKEIKILTSKPDSVVLIKSVKGGKVGLKIAH